MSAATPRSAPRILGLFAAGLMVATALTATVTVLPSTPVQAQQQLQAAAIDPAKGFADLVDRVMPAVVSVQVKFANAASAGEGDQQAAPELPENSPFRDFFKQFPQFRSRASLIRTSRRAAAWPRAPASSSPLTAMP